MRKSPVWDKGPRTTAVDIGEDCRSGDCFYEDRSSRGTMLVHKERRARDGKEQTDENTPWWDKKSNETAQNDESLLHSDHAGMDKALSRNPGFDESLLHNEEEEDSFVENTGFERTKKSAMKILFLVLLCTFGTFGIVYCFGDGLMLWGSKLESKDSRGSDVIIDGSYNLRGTARASESTSNILESISMVSETSKSTATASETSKSTVTASETSKSTATASETSQSTTSEFDHNAASPKPDQDSALSTSDQHPSASETSSSQSDQTPSASHTSALQTATLQTASSLIGKQEIQSITKEQSQSTSQSQEKQVPKRSEFSIANHPSEQEMGSERGRAPAFLQETDLVILGTNPLSQGKVGQNNINVDENTNANGNSISRADLEGDLQPKGAVHSFLEAGVSREAMKLVDNFLFNPMRKVKIIPDFESLDDVIKNITKFLKKRKMTEAIIWDATLTGTGPNMSDLVKALKNAIPEKYKKDADEDVDESAEAPSKHKQEVQAVKFLSKVLDEIEAELIEHELKGDRIGKTALQDLTEKSTNKKDLLTKLVFDAIFYVSMENFVFGVIERRFMGYYESAGYVGSPGWPPITTKSLKSIDRKVTLQFSPEMEEKIDSAQTVHAWLTAIAKGIRERKKDSEAKRENYRDQTPESLSIDADEKTTGKLYKKILKYLDSLLDIALAESKEPGKKRGTSYVFETEEEKKKFFRESFGEEGVKTKLRRLIEKASDDIAFRKRPNSLDFFRRIWLGEGAKIRTNSNSQKYFTMAMSWFLSLDRQLTIKRNEVSAGSIRAEEALWKQITAIERFEEKLVGIRKGVNQNNAKVGTLRKAIEVFIEVIMGYGPATDASNTVHGEFLPNDEKTARKEYGVTYGNIEEKQLRKALQKSLQKNVRKDDPQNQSTEKMILSPKRSFATFMSNLVLALLAECDKGSLKRSTNRRHNDSVREVLLSEHDAVNSIISVAVESAQKAVELENKAVEFAKKATKQATTKENVIAADALMADAEDLSPDLRFADREVIDISRLNWFLFEPLRETVKNVDPFAKKMEKEIKEILRGLPKKGAGGRIISRASIKEALGNDSNMYKLVDVLLGVIASGIKDFSPGMQLMRSILKDIKKTIDEEEEEAKREKEERQKKREEEEEKEKQRQKKRDEEEKEKQRQKKRADEKKERRRQRQAKRKNDAGAKGPSKSPALGSSFATTKMITGGDDTPEDEFPHGMIVLQDSSNSRPGEVWSSSAFLQMATRSSEQESHLEVGTSFSDMGISFLEMGMEMENDAAFLQISTEFSHLASALLEINSLTYDLRPARKLKLPTIGKKQFDQFGKKSRNPEHIDEDSNKPELIDDKLFQKDKGELIHLTTNSIFYVVQNELYLAKIIKKAVEIVGNSYFTNENTAGGGKRRSTSNTGVGEGRKKIENIDVKKIEAATRKVLKNLSDDDVQKSTKGKESKESRKFKGGRKALINSKQTIHERLQVIETAIAEETKRITEGRTRMSKDRTRDDATRKMSEDDFRDMIAKEEEFEQSLRALDHTLKRYHYDRHNPDESAKAVVLRSDRLIRKSDNNFGKERGDFQGSIRSKIIINSSDDRDHENYGGDLLRGRDHGEDSSRRKSRGRVKSAQGVAKNAEGSDRKNFPRATTFVFDIVLQTIEQAKHPLLSEKGRPEEIEDWRAKNRLMVEDIKTWYTVQGESVKKKMNKKLKGTTLRGGIEILMKELKKSAVLKLSPELQNPSEMPAKSNHLEMFAKSSIAKSSIGGIANKGDGSVNKGETKSIIETIKELQKVLADSRILSIDGGVFMPSFILEILKITRSSSSSTIMSNEKNLVLPELPKVPIEPTKPARPRRPSESTKQDEEFYKEEKKYYEEVAWPNYRINKKEYKEKMEQYRNDVKQYNSELAPVKAVIQEVAEKIFKSLDGDKPVTVLFECIKKSISEHTSVDPYFRTHDDDTLYDDGKSEISLLIFGDLQNWFYQLDKNDRNAILGSSSDDKNLKFMVKGMISVAAKSVITTLQNAGDKVITQTVDAEDIAVGMRIPEDIPADSREVPPRDRVGTPSARRVLITNLLVNLRDSIAEIESRGSSPQHDGAKKQPKNEVEKREPGHELNAVTTPLLDLAPKDKSAMESIVSQSVAKTISNRLLYRAVEYLKRSPKISEEKKERYEKRALEERMAQSVGVEERKYQRPTWKKEFDEDLETEVEHAVHEALSHLNFRFAEKEDKFGIPPPKVQKVGDFLKLSIMKLWLKGTVGDSSSPGNHHHKEPPAVKVIRLYWDILNPRGPEQREAVIEMLQGMIIDDVGALQNQVRTLEAIENATGDVDRNQAILSFAEDLSEYIQKVKEI